MRSRVRTSFPLFLWLLIILCFFIFPLFLLNSALEKYCKLIQQDQRKNELQKTKKTLLRLSNYADGTRFFNFVLQNHLAKPIIGSNSRNELKNRISILKKSYPDAFEFTVWDSKGRVIKALTDHPNYIYFLRKLNLFLKSLQELTIASFPQTPIISKALSSEVRSLRQFLGPFVPAAKIAKSFVPSSKRKCFLLSGKGKRAYGWYSAQTDFSIFAYISLKAVKSLIGAKRFCLRNNKNGGNKLFLIHEQSLKIFPKATPELANLLATNLQKIGSITPPELLQSNNSLFAYQSLKNGWWAAVIMDEKRILDIETHGQAIFIKIVAAMIIAFFILRCYFLVHKNPFSSIRWKLFLVFIYTVAIPMMIFSTVGFEYLSQKTKRVESAKGIDLFQLLVGIDQKFTTFLKTEAEKINSLIENSFWEKDMSHTNLTALAVKLKQKFAAKAILIFDEKGNSTLPKEFADQVPDSVVMKSISVDMLHYLNDIKLDNPVPIKVFAESSILSLSDTNRKIKMLNIGNSYMSYYLNTLKSPRSKKYEFTVQLFWDIREFQSLFFEELKRNFANEKQLELILFFPDRDSSADQTFLSPEVLDFLAKVNLHGSHLETITGPKSKKILAAGILGQKLEKAVTGVLYDYSPIFAEIDSLKKVMGGLFLLSILFSLSLYRLLNYQILKPIEHLVTGVEKVKARDYAHRIPIQSDNELGKLGKSINDTLENLQELEIARVVQEELLPEDSLENKNFEVFAQTRPMHKLGGDYYDFYANSDGKLMAMIADVAGHGVQAALMMAMAKSVFLLEQGDLSNEDVIMNKLNSTFYKLRKSAIKTMMTCQIVSFSAETGKSYLNNAGHCPPLIVSSDGKHVTTLDLPSMPLGYGGQRNFLPKHFELPPGSIMVLYTDGIVESLNSEQKVLGTEGFIAIIKESFSSDLKTYYNGIMTLYDDWRENQEDDITFVLIRRKEDES